MASITNTLNIKTENNIVKKKDIKIIKLNSSSHNRISNIYCKQDLLMISLSEYFSNNKSLENVLDIINGTSNISLRLIDWFVTNYCKRKNIIYDIEQNDMKTKFIVHLNYKTQLKSFSKKQFDPFKRDSRIEFEYKDNNSVITTIGQLNFFRWAIKSNIITYIEANYKEIEKDMNTFSKKENKVKKNRRKKNINKKINIHETSIMLDFS